MDTTISGGAFRTLPEILSILTSADRKDRRPKARSSLPAPAPLACQARAAPLPPSRSFRPLAPLGSARLSSAALAFAFGCFRSRKRRAAEPLPARAADVGQAAASSSGAGLLESRSSPRVCGRRRGRTGSGGEAGGHLRYARPGRWKGGCPSALGRAPRATSVPTAAGATAALEAVFFSVWKCPGSSPASFLGAPGLAVRLLPPRLFGVSRGPHPTSIPAALTPASVLGSPRDPTSIPLRWPFCALLAGVCRGARPPSSEPRFALA